MIKVSASLLSARDNLDNMIYTMNNLDIDYIHLDIMDGLFVPNTSYTDDEINNIMNNSKKMIDVHLMVNDLEKYINYYIKDNVESITIHYEALKDLNVIDQIKNKNIKCGISIKPDTKVESIYHLLPFIDKVLIMSVEPGSGGQPFIPSSLDKISKLRKKIDSLNLNVLISVDGGINNNSAKECIESGVDILVIGSALTNNSNKSDFISQIKM